MSFFDAAPQLFSDAAALRDAAIRRVSRRSYLGSVLSADNKEAVKAIAGRLSQAVPQVSVAVDFDNGKAIFEMLGLFATIKRPPCTAAFIVDSRDPLCYEKCGYVGEAFVLEMTRLGLDTCWVTGTYSKSGANRVFSPINTNIVGAVTPVGYASDARSASEQFTEATVNGRNRRPQNLILPAYDSAPQWIRDAVDCARIAPSAVNGQPWNFDLVDGELCIARPDSGSTNKRVDLGIAMFHVDVSAKVSGIEGRWEPMEGRYLARYALK